MPSRVIHLAVGFDRSQSDLLLENSLFAEFANHLSAIQTAILVNREY